MTEHQATFTCVAIRVVITNTNIFLSISINNLKKKSYNLNNFIKSIFSSH